MEGRRSVKDRTNGRGEHGLVYNPDETTGGGPESFFGKVERTLKRQMGAFAAQLAEGKHSLIRDHPVRKQTDARVLNDLELRDMSPQG